MGQDSEPPFNPILALQPKWASGGPLDRWVGAAPASSDINAIYQLTLVADKVDTLDGLERLIALYPKEPFLLVRLADIYSLLQYSYGAKCLALRALEIIRVGTDRIFEDWVNTIVNKCLQDEHYQIDVYNLAKNVTYASKIRTMAQYSTAEPLDQSRNVVQEWGTLARTLSRKEVTTAYARMLCIETNELEDVFLLSNKSITGLVHGGFFVGAIEHVDASSKLRDKNAIINVLNGVQDALNVIGIWAHDTDMHFTADLPIRVHKLIMASNRINVHYDTTTKIPYRVLIPTGEWRHKSVYVQRDDNSIIMFHPFNEVARSMEMFADLARPIIADIKNTGRVDNLILLLLGCIMC